jgi:hypothetical protein
LTVSNERARGLRAVGERSDGFTVTASRTIAVSVKRLYDTLLDESMRKAWLPNRPSAQADRHPAEIVALRLGPRARRVSTSASPPKATRRARSRSSTRDSPMPRKPRRIGANASARSS